MKHSFQNINIDEEDDVLINQVLNGSKVALESLIKKHQNYIYNAALAMVSDRDVAADITQEVLIKVITKLGSFQSKSSFRTWLYRIVKNEFLNMKRGSYEIENFSFDDFAKGLHLTPDESLSNYTYETDNELIVEEAKLSCMKGMLLCLDREQRFIYIIGELFEFPDTIGSEIMEITKVNFRVKLHRTRQQLYDFMDNKCGLINKNNPCRCAKKTAGFIKNGYVDPVNLHFQKDRIATIGKLAGKKIKALNDEVYMEYQQLFQDHPFIQSPDCVKSINKLLSSKTIRETFNLDED